MEVKDKLDLYFFDPTGLESDYENKYFEIAIREQYIRKSPLYLMRRDIRLLTGQVSGVKRQKHDYPYYPALMVAVIVIDHLKGLLRIEDDEIFYKKYFEIDTNKAVGLKILRNGIVHNNYQLFHRVGNLSKKDKGYYYLLLQRYLIASGQLSTEDVEDPNFYFKVKFVIETNPGALMIQYPKLVNCRKEESHALVSYSIQPFLFLDRLDKIVNQIKEEILASQDLLSFFDETVTLDNWTVYIPSWDIN